MQNQLLTKDELFKGYTFKLGDRVYEKGKNRRLATIIGLIVQDGGAVYDIRLPDQKIKQIEESHLIASEEPNVRTKNS